MSTQKKTLRRSGAKIMASLILLLGSLSYIMILAVINGSVGFVCAMGVTVFGAVGVAKALGEAIALSYGWIIGLTIGCGVLRGLLRYFEQYLSEVNSYMQQLSDDGILSMTSENDIDIANMDESPNALFVIVPDERFTRHRFVTLFLTQTYKELVEKANTNLRKKQTDTAILKRRAYFILDEFGNLPKMENIEGMRVKKHMFDVTLTRALCFELIDKIVIGRAVSGEPQSIGIYYKVDLNLAQ